MSVMRVKTTVETAEGLNLWKPAAAEKPLAKRFPSQQYCFPEIPGHCFCFVSKLCALTQKSRLLLSWVRPSQQLSTMEPLTHSASPGRDGKGCRENRQNPRAEVRRVYWNTLREERRQ